jgi:hypothetical protein
VHESQRAVVTEGRKNLALRQGGYHSAWGWVAPCLCCEWWFPLERLTREHIVSRANGGGGEDANLALACARCNNERVEVPDPNPPPLGPARPRPRRFPRPSAAPTILPEPRPVAKAAGRPCEPLFAVVRVAEKGRRL